MRHLLILALALVFFGCVGQPEAPVEPEMPAEAPEQPSVSITPGEPPEDLAPEAEAEPPEGVLEYELNGNAKGYMEQKGHLHNLGVVSNDGNVLKAEYEAGFVQGRLQKEQLAYTRDNLWDCTALTDASPYKSIPPSEAQLEQAQGILLRNYNYTVNYAEDAEPELKERMQRILFRMLGVYHGATKEEPEELDFSGEWMPGTEYFGEEELEINYGNGELSFLDAYYLNAGIDLLDVIDGLEGTESEAPSKCSAFMKKDGEEFYFAHNSWSCFLSQTMAQTYYIAGDYLTFNGANPGVVVSLNDYGYNGNGIAFLETTHHNTYSEPRVEALWMFMRSALAEQFAGSVDEFYELVSLEASGTYMNGFMVYDEKAGEMGLVEMSYKSFVYFKSLENGSYEVVTKPEGLSTEYDHELVQPGILLGVNYPASHVIQEELQATENRPARRAQFLAMIGDVHSVEDAKGLITYTAEDEPLSIYGRWDLGWGDTTTPQKVPDGAIDAKAASGSMMDYAYELEGVLDYSAPRDAFWMRWGTPVFEGKPFIWSESNWSNQTLRGVPDEVGGEYQVVNVYIR